MPEQSNQEYGKGYFLIANPVLPDPNFSRTVVLLCNHDDVGSFGLVINRPALVNSKEVFKILFGLKKSNRVIIFATHNRYFANMADCKIELLNGRINAKNARVSKNI